MSIFVSAIRMRLSESLRVEMEPCWQAACPAWRKHLILSQGLTNWNTEGSEVQGHTIYRENNSRPA